MKKHSWKAKILLSIFGFILALVLLELGLRLAGFIFHQTQTRAYIPDKSSYIKELRYQRDSSYEEYQSSRQDKKLKKIVCIGDSFANGGNARSFQTYPYYLFKFFEKAGKPVMVLNMGECEDSTFGTARRLEHYLNNIKKEEELPDIITFIVGSADKYNLNPAFDANVKTVRVNWHDEPGGWFKQLRIYKLYRHIKLGLFSRKLLRDLKRKSPITREVIDDYLGLYEEFKQNCFRHHWTHWRDKPGKEFKNKNQQIADAFAKMAPKHFSSANTEYLTLASAAEVLNSISTGLVILYAAKLRHDDALDLILDVAKHFPLEFWEGKELVYLRFNLYQIYQLQSKYTAKEMIGNLEEMRDRHPVLERSKRFYEFHHLVSNWEQIDEIVDQKRLHTWEKIVNMCRQRNIQMIVQNYPSDYRSANNMISKVARRYNLPMIDNHRLFTELAKKHGRERYLEDDDHCSPEGYEILAREVFRLIKEKGYL